MHTNLERIYIRAAGENEVAQMITEALPKGILLNTRDAKYMAMHLANAISYITDV
ncbi:MAG: hypothetical protein K2P38_07970 [Lachnospiraceae bacterium]|nr:hypothetical protein [Lachnospiraceae bacterium]